MNNLEKIPLGIYEKGIPLSVNWYEKFKIAKDAGFDYIELSIDGKPSRLNRLDWDDGTISAIKDLSQAFSMPFRTMALSANRFYPLGDGFLFAEGIEIVKKAIVLARKLDIPVIQIAPYDVYQKESTLETRNRFTTSLKELLEFARKYQITLAMEVLEDVLHFSKVSLCTAYIQEMNHPNLMLYADTGNVAYNGFNVAEDLFSDCGKIIACHLKDAIIHNEHNIPYGTGLVDFNACLKYFKQINYAGTFTAEVWCEEDLDFIPKLKEIQTFLRNKIKEENRL